MNRNSSFKRSLTFLTAAALTASMFGCGSKQVSEPERELTDEPVAQETATEPAQQAAPVKVTQTQRDYVGLFSDRDKAQTCDRIDGEIDLSGISDKTVTITDGGIYRLSGKLDGQVIINAPKAKVQLLLDGAEINSSDSAAICCTDADKLFITTADGSSNSINGGAVSNEEGLPDAAIYCADSLTLNGLGRLTVKSSGDGIHSKDDIVITGGDMDITAEGCGIKGRDYVAACGGDVTVKSGSDGVRSTNDQDEAMGFIYIGEGSFNVVSDEDGLQAQTDLVISGGEVSVTSGGGSSSGTKVHTDDFGGFNKGDKFNKDDKFSKDDLPEGFDPDKFGGRPGGGMTPPDGFDPGSIMPPGDFQPGDMPDGMAPPDGISGAAPDNSGNSDTSSEVSTKGLKGIGTVEISGGTVVVDSADDAIHSNGGVFISGGGVTLSAWDDGIHADSQVSISEGSVSILTSYEGIEGAVIEISGGTVELKSTDDGLNASDGTSQMGLGTYSSGVQLTISGGSLYVDAEGDGLDSNGDLTITGGTVLVNGPTIGANGALDSNSEIVVNGGLVIAAGSSSMAEYPGDGSAQCSVSVTFDASQTAGTLVTLEDESGSEIVSFAPGKKFENIVISSPDIERGRTYNVNIGGKSASSEVHGLYEPGGIVDKGTSAGSFTADQVTSFIGRQSMMGGGFGGHGGDKGGFDKGDFQMPTDENGQPHTPEDGFGGFGGKRPGGDRKKS